MVLGISNDDYSYFDPDFEDLFIRDGVKQIEVIINKPKIAHPGSKKSFWWSF